MTFSARKVEISDDLKAYATKKFKRLDRFFSQDATATIKFRIENVKHIVEATVQSDKLTFRAEEVTTDLYASVDGAVDIIERQIRKNKTRLEKRLRDGAFERELQALPQDDYEIVRRKRFGVEPMTVEEAILQMSLLNHSFFFFKNIDDDDRHCVVYRRQDAGYGLIESD